MREQPHPSGTDASARPGSDAAGRQAGVTWGGIHRPPWEPHPSSGKPRARTLYTAFLAASFVLATVLSIPLAQFATGPAGHGGRVAGPQAAGPGDLGRLAHAGQGQ